MLARPLLVAFVIGTSLAVAATGSVSPGLVLTTTIAWSFVVLIQLAAALAIIATASRRTKPLAHAIDEFFALHVPWSLWIIGYATWAWVTVPAGRHSSWVLWTALLPASWTALLIYGFCRAVLAEPHRAALVRTCVHQAIVWGAFLVIAGEAVGLWPRGLRWLGLA